MTVTGPGVQSNSVPVISHTRQSARAAGTRLSGRVLQAYCERAQDPVMDDVSVTTLGSVSLAGLAAHLPEIWPAAELKPEHQGAVGHSVHIFTLCRRDKGEEASPLHLKRCIFNWNLAGF